MGFAKDTDLIKANHGDFGLSWYGESLNSGEGKIGEYMEYNNPHKISLYLRCSAPIIIWSKAGLASFVQREHVGICLDSLTELENKIASIGINEYLEMKKNVDRIAQQLGEGHYFKTAFEKALAICQQK